MKNKKILLFLLVTVLAGMMCLNGCGISREPENLQSEEEILQEDASEEDGHFIFSHDLTPFQ